jgi:hypothetical protein
MSYAGSIHRALSACHGAGAALAAGALAAVIVTAIQPAAHANGQLTSGPHAGLTAARTAPVTRPGSGYGNPGAGIWTQPGAAFPPAVIYSPAVTGA